MTTNGGAEIEVVGGGGRVKKQHICLHCRRAFRRSEHLQRHIRTHTREKPYSCHCGEAFARPDLLKRHYRVAHADHSGNRGQNSLGSPAAVNSTSGGPTSTAGYAPIDSSTDTFNSGALPLDAVASGFAPSLNLLTDAENHSFPLTDPNNVVTSQDQQDVYALSHDPDPYQEFAGFIDSMGLTFDWDTMMYQNYPDFSNSFENGVHIDANIDESPPHLADNTNRRGVHLASRTENSTILPIPRQEDGLNRRHAATLYPLELDENQMQVLHSSMSHYQSCVPDFTLPSRHALTRYLNAYFDSFYPHLPFIHAPTFDPSTCNLELVLAMAAAGAQYRFEHSRSLSLFLAAKSILNERMKERESSSRTLLFPDSRSEGSIPSQLSPGSHRGQNYLSPGTPARSQSQSLSFLMDDARCLLCMLVFSTWKFDPNVTRYALAIQSTLVQSVREAGLEEQDKDAQGLDWRSWARMEMDKRTKFLAFCFLNFQSIAFDVPPILLGKEIHLSLPSTSEEWAAVDEEHWLAQRQQSPTQQNTFAEALDFLLRKSNGSSYLRPIPSALGNYVLIHGLLQRVFLIRQASLSSDDDDSLLPAKDLESLENALRSWTLGWQQAPESSLDPQNPNGPIPFTSSALLGLVYCRICLDIGPYRGLRSKDPQHIAEKLLKVPALHHGPTLIPALLHATHAINIPVKLGVEYVARSQGFFWSIQHAVSSLESAILLSKWLYELEGLQGKRPLEKQESSLVEWIRQIAIEGRNSLDQAEDLADTGFGYRDLAFLIVKLWSVIMRGNVQWKMVNVIGQALELYADICRSKTTNNIV